MNNTKKRVLIKWRTLYLTSTPTNNHRRYLNELINLSIQENKIKLRKEKISKILRK